MNDARDATTKAMDDLIEQVPELVVDRQHRQVNKNQDEFTTASMLRQYTAAFERGIAGLQRGEPQKTYSHRSELVDWTKQLIETLGVEKFEDRDKYVCSGSCVFVALGLLGHYAYVEHADDETMPERLQERLADIDWTAGEHWNAIAGKWTTRIVQPMKKNPITKQREPVGEPYEVKRLVIFGPKEGAGHVLRFILKQPPVPPVETVVLTPEQLKRDFEEMMRPDSTPKA